MVSILLELPIVYARPWLTATEEKPVPTPALHRIFGPSAGQSVWILSDEIPFRCGPRHCGQSSADTRQPQPMANERGKRISGVLICKDPSLVSPIRESARFYETG